MRDPDGEEWEEDEEWASDESGAEWVPGAEARPVPAIDDDHAAAVRTVRLLVAAAALAVLGVVAWGLARVADDEDTSAGVGDDPTIEVASGVVAPPAGAPVGGYISDQAARLAVADGTRVAVVSFVSYRSGAVADAFIAEIGGDDVEVVARLVALPGGEPAVATEPLADWLAAQRAPLQTERDEIAGLLPTIESPDDPFVAAYNEDLVRLDAQLAALDPAADLVYGVVLRARVDELRALAARPEVRVVAVADNDDVPDDATYRGLRPEETAVIGAPPARP